MDANFLLDTGLFDTHAHYDDKRFDEDRDDLISGLFDSGKVYGIVNCGCDIDTSKKSLALAHKYKRMYAAVGIHPHEASKVTDADYEKIRQMLSDEKTVALGEIGLDYHYDFSPRDIQKTVFENQLLLAEELGMPVVIHDREAHADCIGAVLRHPEVRGVFHSFSGSAETARLLQKQGWYLSFSGPVTFKDARKTVEAVAATANDRLLVETDCPYLTPVPHRGKRNHSGYVCHIIEKIAEIRGESYEFIETLTRENAKRFFGIKD